MGIITDYEDTNTGLVIQNAYISLYTQVIKITSCDDRLVAQALTSPSPAPTNQLKKYNVDAIFNIYINKSARDSNKEKINFLQIQDGYTDDCSKIFNIAYEELKKIYPNSTDDN